MQYGPLQAGQVVAGRYEIERELGRGGMGAVYVVRHRGTGKAMALKCLLPELLDNADFVARFLREAQVAGTVHHRNVIDVYDVGRDGDVLYMVMELLDGKPLTALLQDEAMTLEQALLIILRAMEGVSAVHAQGIIHRDLKPDNIFVTYGTDGRLDHPKVLDFGISKLDGAGQGSLTQSGVALGTPYYMSLEQLSGRRDLDARVDVYAMGVILYEAIAGSLPYWAESISALAIKLLTHEPAHLGRLRPDLPPGLAGVIMRAMALERDRRHPTLEDLIDDLVPFVPQASRVRLPEGSGRPLRTPRSGQAHLDERETVSLPAIQARAAHDPTAPAIQSLPVAAPPAVAEPAPSHTAARQPRSAWIAWGVGSVCALLLGIAGRFALQPDGQATGPEPVQADGAAQPPKRAEAPKAAPPVAASEATRSETQAALDASSASTATQTLPSANSDAGVAAAPHGREARRLRSRHPAATTATPAPPTAAAPKDAPSAPESAALPAQGRAGVLGKGDFQ